jgi:hypothetical protein
MGHFLLRRDGFVDFYEEKIILLEELLQRGEIYLQTF